MSPGGARPPIEITSFDGIAAAANAGAAGASAPHGAAPGGHASTPTRWTAERIGQHVATAAKATGADPIVLLAVIDVETGGTFNPKATGDHGTSFGLFQLHQGGALGTHTKQWAYNPANSIADGASRLKGARDGAGAAAVQRPADPRGYARKVDASIARAKRYATRIERSVRRPKQSALRRLLGHELPRRFKVHHTSGDRTPAHNAAVGGVEGSDHVTTQVASWADDYVGTAAQMNKALTWVRSNYGAQIKQMMIHDAGSGQHLHIAGWSDGYPHGGGS